MSQDFRPQDGLLRTDAVANANCVHRSRSAQGWQGGACRNGHEDGEEQADHGYRTPLWEPCQPSIRHLIRDDLARIRSLRNYRGASTQLTLASRTTNRASCGEIAVAGVVQGSVLNEAVGLSAWSRSPGSAALFLAWRAMPRGRIAAKEARRIFP